MASVKRLCGSLCSSPLVSMVTDTNLHLSPDLYWNVASSGMVVKGGSVCVCVCVCVEEDGERNGRRATEQ